MVKIQAILTIPGIHEDESGTILFAQMHSEAKNDQTSIANNSANNSRAVDCIDQPQRARQVRAHIIIFNN